MSRSVLSERARLMQEVSAALRDGANGADLIDLVIRSGWQTRIDPDPGSIHLQGVLVSGRRVPIEIRQAPSSRSTS